MMSLKLSEDKYLLYKNCTKEMAIWYYSSVESHYTTSRYDLTTMYADDSYKKSDLANLDIESIYTRYGHAPEDSSVYADGRDLRMELGEFAVNYAKAHGGLSKFVKKLLSDMGDNEDLENVVDVIDYT